MTTPAEVYHATQQQVLDSLDRPKAETALNSFGVSKAKAALKIAAAWICREATETQQTYAGKMLRKAVGEEGQQLPTSAWRGRGLRQCCDKQL